MVFVSKWIHTKNEQSKKQTKTHNQSFLSEYSSGIILLLKLLPDSTIKTELTVETNERSSHSGN